MLRLMNTKINISLSKQFKTISKIFIYILYLYEVPTRCVPSNPCLNGAECIDDEQYEGGVRCECGTGWTGATCAEGKYSCLKMMLLKKVIK